MSRMIDADALIETIENHPISVPCCDTVDIAKGKMQMLKQVLDDIRNSPTVGGWISVKERLPKSIANKVLVYVEHEDLVGYIGYGHYEKYKGVEMWYDLEHNEQFTKRGYAVTHWMPLPEPPKEEE